MFIVAHLTPDLNRHLIIHASEKTHFIKSYIILHTGMSQPYRIDIFEDLIYGTDLKHEVFRVHKYGKQPVELLGPAIEKATHVMIAHRFKQQDGKDLFVANFFPP